MTAHCYSHCDSWKALIDSIINNNDNDIRSNNAFRARLSNVALKQFAANTGWLYPVKCHG